MLPPLLLLLLPQPPSDPQHLYDIDVFVAQPAATRIGEALEQLLPEKEVSPDQIRPATCCWLLHACTWPAEGCGVPGHRSCAPLAGGHAELNGLCLKPCADCRRRACVVRRAHCRLRRWTHA